MLRNVDWTLLGQIEFGRAELRHSNCATLRTCILRFASVVHIGLGQNNRPCVHSRSLIWRSHVCCAIYERLFIPLCGIFVTLFRGGRIIKFLKMKNFYHMSITVVYIIVFGINFRTRTMVLVLAKIIFTDSYLPLYPGKKFVCRWCVNLFTGARTPIAVRRKAILL